MRSAIVLPIVAASLASGTPLIEKRQSTGCRTFTQVGDAYTKPANDTKTVTAGAICPGNCTLTASGMVEQGGSLNITTTGQNTTNPAFSTTLLAIIGGSANGLGDSETITGYVPDNTTELQDGQIGYLGFTVTLNCVEGTLCAEDYGVQDGTPVEACAAAYDGGSKMFNGTFSFVTTDEDTARDSINPADRTEAYYNETVLGIDPPGAAAGIQPKWTVGVGMTLAAVAMACL